MTTHSDASKYTREYIEGSRPVMCSDPPCRVADTTLALSPLGRDPIPGPTPADLCSLPTACLSR